MTTSLIPLTSAVVLRGQGAWRRIKFTAAEQRQLWREVGEALNEGRRLHTSNQGFGTWCKEHGFDMAPSVRSNAMWLADNWGAVASCSKCKTESHPTNLRTILRESQDTTEPAATLPQDAPVSTAATAVLKNQRRLAAVDAHRKGTGPEAVTAQRQFAKTAETLGVSQDELSTLIDKMDPFGKLPPALRPGLQVVMNDVQKFAHDLKAEVARSGGILTADYL